MRYTVMQRGHRIGHRRLEYGASFAPSDLGLSEADLRPFVTRGVLRPATDAVVAGKPVRRGGKNEARRDDE